MQGKVYNHWSTVYWLATIIRYASLTSVMPFISMPTPTLRHTLYNIHSYIVNSNTIKVLRLGGLCSYYKMFYKWLQSLLLIL